MYEPQLYAKSCQYAKRAKCQMSSTVPEHHHDENRRSKIENREPKQQRGQSRCHSTCPVPWGGPRAEESVFGLFPVPDPGSFVFFDLSSGFYALSCEVAPSPGPVGHRMHGSDSFTAFFGWRRVRDICYINIVDEVSYSSTTLGGVLYGARHSVFGVMRIGINSVRHI